MDTNVYINDKEITFDKDKICTSHSVDDSMVYSHFKGTNPTMYLLSTGWGQKYCLPVDIWLQIHHLKQPYPLLF